MKFVILLFFIFSCSNKYIYSFKQDSTFIKKTRVPRSIHRSCLKFNVLNCKKSAMLSLKDNLLENAFYYYNAGCNLDDGESCYLAGILESKKNKLESVRMYFNKACKYKSGAACLELAVDNLKQQTSSRKKIKKLLTSSCDYKYFPGCQKLGEFYGKYGTEYDSMKYFFIGCKGGEAASCFNIGIKLLHQNKLPNANKYFDKACNMKHSISCYNLSCNYSKKNDFNNSIKYFTMALQLGFNNWNQIKFDGDLKFLKRFPNFNEILKQYKQ